jgi:glycosyltransferase involved in cell wall biosynthesis
MTRLVFVTQLVDPADPVLGVTIDLVRALGERCERVVVVANDVRPSPRDLGVEIISLGKEAGAGRFRRGLRYELAIGNLARRLQPDALVAHMCPIYLNLATPIAKAFRVRMLLWFIYPRASLALLAAERFSDCIVTALPGSYPRRNANVHAIGHAIDISTFEFAPPRSPGGPLRLLSLGRTTPVKQHMVTLRAVASARQRIDVELRIVGASTTRLEQQHRIELERLIDELNLRSIVVLEDPVPRSKVPRLLAKSDCLVSATSAGSADKSVFEAMAVGRPTLVSNPAFDSMLQGPAGFLRFTEGDHDDLSARIEAIAHTNSAERGAIGEVLRQAVERDHSVGHWADRIVELARLDSSRLRAHKPDPLG